MLRKPGRVILSRSKSQRVKQEHLDITINETRTSLNKHFSDITINYLGLDSISSFQANKLASQPCFYGQGDLNYEIYSPRVYKDPRECSNGNFYPSDSAETRRTGIFNLSNIDQTPNSVKACANLVAEVSGFDHGYGFGGDSEDDSCSVIYSGNNDCLNRTSNTDMSHYQGYLKIENGHEMDRSQFKGIFDLESCGVGHAICSASSLDKSDSVFSEVADYSQYEGVSLGSRDSANSVSLYGLSREMFLPFTESMPLPRLRKSNFPTYYRNVSFIVDFGF